MTTIAVSKTMMAGDKQFTYAGVTKMKGKTKIYELPERTAVEVFGVPRALVGFAGTADCIGRAWGWLNMPENKMPRFKQLEMLLLHKHGIFHSSCLDNWLHVDQPYFSIGSGMNFALAAMAAGKDPYEAVKIASKLDANTGLGFNKLEL